VITRFLLALGLIAPLVLVPHRASAQLLRGRALAKDTGRPVERARIMAVRVDGMSVGETVTSDSGFFVLRVRSSTQPFVISITRIGLRPMLSGELFLGSADTLDVDFEVAEEGIITDTVKVTAGPSLNELRLREAERRGWRVFSPSEVAKVRDRAQSFEDLLRSTGYPGLVISPKRDECIRSTRTYQCLTIVVDGAILMGSYPLINPRDVYFMAFLSPNQAMVQFGDRAPNGALMVHTRANGDKD